MFLLESLDVRYCFLSKAWRDRRRLTLYHFDLSYGFCGKSPRVILVGSAAFGAEIHFNIILSTICKKLCNRVNHHSCNNLSSSVAL